jgi:hypothetical protein
MLLAGALVGVSIWCLGLVQQVHSEQVSLDRPDLRIQTAETSAGSVGDATEPSPPHPGMPG